MTALLAELPRLASSLAATDSSSSDSMKCKTLFLQLLGRLLELDSKLVLDISQPAFSFVFKSYLGTLAVRYSPLIVCWCAKLHNMPQRVL